MYSKECIQLIDKSKFLIESVEEGATDLKESLNYYGFIEPVIAYLEKSVYKVIQGKRRVAASTNSQIPTIVIHTDGEKAKQLRATSILSTKDSYRRSVSEIANIVYDYYISVKAQGKRTDLVEGLENYSSLEDCSNRFSISQRTIGRYLRIHELCNELKNLLDASKVSIKVAVELSYLTKQRQIIIAALIDEGNNISLDVAVKLKTLEKQGALSISSIGKVLNKEGICSCGFKKMRGLFQKYRMYRYTDEEVERILDHALAKYFGNEGKINWY